MGNPAAWPAHPLSERSFLCLLFLNQQRIILGNGRSWYRFTLYENLSSREFPLYIPQVENPSLSVLFEDEHGRKEKFMTTRVRDEARGQGEQGDTAFESIKPFLFASLIGRRQESGEGVVHPLLLAALMGRRQESGEGISPIVLAALMGRRQESDEGISPVVLAALMARRGEQEMQTV
jgi:hypothetical protein